MKTLRLLALVLVVVFLFAGSVLAQGTSTGTPTGNLTITGASVGAGLGAALTIIGAGYGFGRIGSSALESMARQPEVAGKVQVAMLIIAALLEGATFFALAICYQISTVAKF